MGEFCVVASPPLQVDGVFVVYAEGIRKVGPIPASPRDRAVRHPELVSGSVGRTRGKGKRFRTKFGMTEGAEVGVARL